MTHFSHHTSLLKISATCRYFVDDVRRIIFIKTIYSKYTQNTVVWCTSLFYVFPQINVFQQKILVMSSKVLH
jgi:hypothetical protein